MVNLFSSPLSTPRRSRKSHGNKESQNPYSSSGLDKFSALLTELEEKRQKIYSKMDPEDEHLVRFVYTSSNECVPVLIKSKEKTSDKEEKKRSDGDFKDKAVTYESEFSAASRASSLDKEMNRSEPDLDKKPEKKPCKLNVKLNLMKRPSYCLTVTTILILVFLALFSRSFAILCICIVWYIVPIIKGRSSNGKTSMKKKDYVRRLSNENKGSYTPRSRNHTGTEERSLPLSAHRKS